MAEKRKFYEDPWFWLFVIALLLWLWWRWKRSSAPASKPVTTSGPIQEAPSVPADDGNFSAVVDTALAPPSEPGSGSGYQTLAGYAKGDTSSSALLNLAQETKDYLNQVNWIDPADGSDSGWPLYEAFLNGYQVTGGDMSDPNMVAATKQITDRLETYKHV